MKQPEKKSGSRRINGLPAVDVVIPAYNAEAYIAAALRSALSQTHSPRRIFVVDDGSTDRTAQVVRRIRDQRVKLIRKSNGGLSSARNAGLAQSRAPWVAFLDADDVWLPRKLQRQIEVLQSTPNVRLGLVYCDYGNIDIQGRSLPGFPCFQLDPRVKGRVRRLLYRGNLVAGSGSAALVRRECFKRVGNFDEQLRSTEDWDMWLRISGEWEMDFAPEKLVMLRRHPQSMSVTHQEEMRLTGMRVLAKSAAVPGESGAVRRAALRFLIRCPWKFCFQLFISKGGLFPKLRSDIFPGAWAGAGLMVLVAIKIVRLPWWVLYRVRIFFSS
jgi:glycosyltransferase involved in cell wall biosynthesis